MMSSTELVSQRLSSGLAYFRANSDRHGCASGAEDSYRFAVTPGGDSSGGRIWRKLRNSARS